MNTQLSISQPLTPSGDSLEERIQGSLTSRVLGEFVSTSALFPILDAIRGIALTGWLHYLTEPAHYALFAAAFIQAWVLGSVKSDKWWVRFFGNLIGFGLYAPLDITIDGGDFFAKPYHWLYGGFSLLIAILSALQTVARHNTAGRTITTILLNVGKISLFPAIYLIIELNLEISAELSWSAWKDYMQSSAHQFIFYGALFFGILLGLAEAQRTNYAAVLRFLARQLKQYSEWSLSSHLIAGALDDPETLQLRRVEKTILFMDIRGFTAWSENVDPQHAVDMLNRFYNTAEGVITRHGGHKPNFTADEIMTRFPSAADAFATALDLQHDLAPILSPYNLAVGIGLHTGEVIEGLMGSDNTRKYDIIGDAANTAKRLESSAGRGEIMMSAATYRALAQPPHNVAVRSLKVKGKADELRAYALPTQKD
jgi:class 3 adenylate cyclase